MGHCVIFQSFCQYWWYYYYLGVCCYTWEFAAFSTRWVWGCVMSLYSGSFLSAWKESRACVSAFLLWSGIVNLSRHALGLTFFLVIALWSQQWLRTILNRSSLCVEIVSYLLSPYHPALVPLLGTLVNDFYTKGTCIATTDLNWDPSAVWVQTLVQGQCTWIWKGFMMFVSEK